MWKSGIQLLTHTLTLTPCSQGMDEMSNASHKNIGEIIYPCLHITQSLVWIYIINFGTDLQSVKAKFANPLHYGCVCKAYNFEFAIKCTLKSGPTWYAFTSVVTIVPLCTTLVIFASAFLSNTLLWHYDQNTNIPCLENYFEMSANIISNITYVIPKDLLCVFIFPSSLSVPSRVVKYMFPLSTTRVTGIVVLLIAANSFTLWWQENKSIELINKLGPDKPGRPFTNDILKCVLIKDVFCILFNFRRIWLLFVQLITNHHWFDLANGLIVCRRLSGYAMSGAKKEVYLIIFCATVYMYSLVFW